MHTVSGVRSGGGTGRVSDARHDAGVAEVLDGAALRVGDRVLDEEGTTHGLTARRRRV